MEQRYENLKKLIAKYNEFKKNNSSGEQVIAKLAMLVRNLEPKQKQNCAQHDFNDENEYRAVLGALK